MSRAAERVVGWRAWVRHALVLTWPALPLGLFSAFVWGAGAVWCAGDLHDGRWALAAQNLIRRGPATVAVAVSACWVGLLAASLVAQRRPRPPVGRGTRQPRGRTLGVLASVAVLAPWCVALVAARRPGAEGDLPNIVLIVVDTLRADHVGCYGATRRITPQIDALAREAIVFARAYSTAPWTRAAVASLLTGTTPLTHGITAEEPGHALPAAMLTLQEALRDEGYWTRALLTNPHYRFGIDQNFDRRWYCGNCRADVIFARAIDFIRGYRGGPFFLLIHNNDPHDSYDYHRGFSTTPEASPYRSLRALFPAHDGDVALDSAVNARDTIILDTAALEEMKRNYDGEIAFLDHHLGRFVAALREDGLLERTILVITADHGEEFLDHGGYWHGGTLYDELLRVPLIVRVPGRAGAIVGTPVSTRDLFTTLIDLAGGRPPATAYDSGHTLRPLLEGRPLPAAPLFAASAFRSRLKYSVIDGDDKLIVYATGEPIGLFNLREDPGERRDVSRVEKARARALQDLLAVRVAAGRRDGMAAAAVRLEASESEQLRALGYRSD